MSLGGSYTSTLYGSPRPTHKDSGSSGGGLSDPVLQRLEKMEATLLGLKKTRIPAQGYADNYEQKYEPDALYEETSPNARIWRVYMDEMATFDRDMIEEMRDALDVLLVFAALFSSIITTFVAQTSQQLSPDYTQMTAFLVFESIQSQEAIANGTDLSSIYRSPVNPQTVFRADLLTVWVNALWFVSLTLSLVTVLATVLVKQWLRQYMTLPSGTVRERACTRQFRYMGFQAWHVAAIVGSLPVLVHISVGLFLAGIIAFLVPIQLSIAILVAAVSGIGLILYIIVNVIPVFVPSCPYRTPISDFMYWISRSLVKLPSNLANFVQNVIDIVILRKQQTWYRGRSLPIDLKLIEKAAVNGDPKLFAHAAFGLYDMSSNPTVHSIVLQTIGGLPDWTHETTRFLASSRPEVAENILKELEAYERRLRAAQPIHEIRLERYLRSGWLLQLQRYDTELGRRFDNKENIHILHGLTDREHRPALFADILRGNIYRDYTHKLPAAVWDAVIFKVPGSLALNCRDEDVFAFVRDACSFFQRNAWPTEMEGLTLAEYVCLAWRYRRPECPVALLMVLPKPAVDLQLRKFIQGETISWERDQNGTVAIAFRLLLCYYDSLNLHAQNKYLGVFAEEEFKCIYEMLNLSSQLFLHLEDCTLAVLDDQFEGYRAFLESALSSSIFWSTELPFDAYDVYCITTAKQSLRRSFLKSLEYLESMKNRLVPSRPSISRAISTRIRQLNWRSGLFWSRQVNIPWNSQDVEMSTRIEKIPVDD